MMLRTAVAGLTAPIVHTHNIEYAGQPIREVTVVLPCLLDQLEEAIASTMGGSGASKASKSSRTVLNSDALHMALTIKSQIIDWCHSAGVKPGKDAAANLLAWEDATPEPELFHIRKLLAWREQIQAQFEPVRHREVLAPCPVCKATSWVDDQGEEKPHPVDITYTAEAFIHTANALCRACEAVWEGAEAVAELGDELTGRTTA